MDEGSHSLKLGSMPKGCRDARQFRIGLNAKQAWTCAVTLTLAACGAGKSPSRTIFHLETNSHSAKAAPRRRVLAKAKRPTPRESRAEQPEGTHTSCNHPQPRDTGLRRRKSLRGRASYYHDSLAGNRTASGERYDPCAYTAAHRTLPFNTWVRVTHLERETSVLVRINDRGPFRRKKRILDLSRAAASALGTLDEGVAPVRVDVLRGKPPVPPF